MFFRRYLTRSYGHCLQLSLATREKEDYCRRLTGWRNQVTQAATWAVALFQCWPSLNDFLDSILERQLGLCLASPAEKSHRRSIITCFTYHRSRTEVSLKSFERKEHGLCIFTDDNAVARVILASKEKVVSWFSHLKVWKDLWLLNIGGLVFLSHFPGT